MPILVITHIALWVVVLAMAAVVVSLMRQTGILLERISPAGLSAKDSLALKKGQAVEKMTLAALDGAQHTVGGALEGVAQLLLFVSPRCDVCKSILPDAVSLAKALPSKLMLTLVVADAAEGALPQSVGHLPQVPAEKIASQFGVAQLPHLVLIREDGRLELSEYIMARADFASATAPLRQSQQSARSKTHKNPLGDLV